MDPKQNLRQLGKGASLVGHWLQISAIGGWGLFHVTAFVEE